MPTKTNERKKPNRLASEKSPYLLQHAYNPVEWYPWGNEAFLRAKEQDKPVFVSIGYSTCHWCHVMEEECFDDEEVANLINQAFVSIKVDQEERPDLDGVYMSMCQVMGKNCGWPLNVIMTPDKNVFFIASYIPKSSKSGSIGMMDLVPQIREIWQTRRLELEKLGDEIKRRIQLFENRLPQQVSKLEIMDDAYRQLADRFDNEHGGFGNAPKFPTPHTLLFLSRYWCRTGQTKAFSMVEKTLNSMRMGGIFDQIGFGFHRYSTDAAWLVPHFEKMLYDQALLVLAYSEAYQATKNDKFRKTAEEILEYVLRDLTSREGGFFSAEDADSEGEEGKFYVWTEPEIRNALSPDDAELAIAFFGINIQGNFANPGRNRGANILHFAKSLEELASEFHLSMNALEERLNRIQKKLFEIRKTRTHPAKDTKILTDWNGLMIAGLSRASQVFGEEKYLQAAIKAANFFIEEMIDNNGTLFHRYIKGERAIKGFLDDYVFLTFGLIELYEACFTPTFLQIASELTNKMITLFWDEKTGGFFFNPKDSDDVILNLKETYDGALPSGNSVALLNLLRLALLSQNTRYEDLAQSLIRAFSSELQESAQSHTFMLNGIDFATGPTTSITLVGDLSDSSTRNLLKVIRAHYLPNVVVTIRTPSESEIGFEQIDGKATAYVCRGQICLPPTNNPETILDLLREQPTGN